MATMTAAQFAALADAQVGKPYLLGAEAKITDPNPAKFDCSELVEWLFGRSGNRITDLAAAQYDATKPVKGEPQVGDLVFLRNNPARSNGIGHVAVLTQKLSNGDWRIVEARGKAAGVVRTTLSYWKSRTHYAGLRRLPSFALATTTPKPTPKSTAFWATTYNCLDPRFGGRADDDAAALKAAAASVYLLTEAPEKVRTNLRKRMSGGLARWKVWERGPQAILFDSTKFAHTNSRTLVVGPTSYHGAVIAVLTRRDTGRRIQFVALHLPPKSVASEATRKSALVKVLKALDPNLPTIIGGDFNSESADEWAAVYGYQAAKTGPTTDKGSRYDYLLIKGGKWAAAELHNPGSASDHRAVRAKASIPAATTT